MSINNNKPDQYRTRDLAESATIFLLGQQLINIERINGVCWFIFEDLNKCKEISNNFWFGKCIVNAKDYYDTINKLKNRIFSI